MAAVIWWRGRRFNQRTVDMISEAERLLGYQLTISQGSYNSSVAASAGTHDGGGAADFSHTATSIVRALRTVGFAAWYRPPSKSWNAHIHAIAIGDSDLSSGAAKQVVSYYNGRNGLAGNGKDNGPKVKKQTWEAYLKTKQKKEDKEDGILAGWTEKKLTQILQKVVRAELIQAPRDEPQYQNAEGDLARRFVWNSPVGGKDGARSYWNQLPTEIWAFQNKEDQPSMFNMLVDIRDRVAALEEQKK